jgi:hypothetical protein
MVEPGENLELVEKINSISFNQASSVFAAATNIGFSIYTVADFLLRHKRKFDGGV